MVFRFVPRSCVVAWPSLFYWCIGDLSSTCMYACTGCLSPFLPLPSRRATWNFKLLSRTCEIYWICDSRRFEQFRKVALIVVIFEENYAWCNGGLQGEGENSSGKMATGFRAAIFGGSWNNSFCGNARACYLKMLQLVETCWNFFNLTLPGWFERKFWSRARQLGACRKITTCWSDEDAWAVPNPDLTVGTTSNHSKVLLESFQQCHVPTSAAFHR